MALRAAALRKIKLLATSSIAGNTLRRQLTELAHEDRELFDLLSVQPRSGHLSAGDAFGDHLGERLFGRRAVQYWCSQRGAAATFAFWPVATGAVNLKEA